MKSKSLLISLPLAITLLAGMGLALGGCVTASKKLKASDTSSYSQKEREIRQMLSSSQNAWNSQNTKVLLDCLSEDAQIMVGREQKMFSKAQYANMLPYMFDRVGKMKRGSPSINVVGDKAEIDVWILFSKISLVWFVKKINLIYSEEKGRWLIQKSVFTTSFRGRHADPREHPKDRGMLIEDSVD